MSEQSASAESLDLRESVSLGSIDPAGSRQLGRRSSVCLRGDAVVAGLDDDSVVAFGADSVEERWRYDGAATAAESGTTGSVVSLVPFADGILAGERSPAGEVRLHDADTGAVRWRHRSADDVGEAQKETRFFLPFVVDAAVAGDRAYVAARRYERDSDGERTFQSVVYAFAPDGELDWRYRTDASPISLDVDRDVSGEGSADGGSGDTAAGSGGADGGRVAVAFNRCPGADRDGVVVLDAASGQVRRRWDPPGDGDRRAGDVSLVDGGFAVASHADFRGYLLDVDGVRWRVDLGRPVERATQRAADGASDEQSERRAQGGETVYAYPNHVHATDDGVVFLTGNTYPEEGRETDVRHPNEHTAVGVAPTGDRRWSATVGGFVHGTAIDGSALLAPVAQHFRDRDPAAHGLRRFDAVAGTTATRQVPGVVTAAAVDGDRIVAVEEPVSYHDDESVRGAYRLRVGRLP